MPPLPSSLWFWPLRSPLRLAADRLFNSSIRLQSRRRENSNHQPLGQEKNRFPLRCQTSRRQPNLGHHMGITMTKTPDTPSPQGRPQLRNGKTNEISSRIPSVQISTTVTRWLRLFFCSTCLKFSPFFLKKPFRFILFFEMFHTAKKILQNVPRFLIFHFSRKSKLISRKMKNYSRKWSTYKKISKKNGLTKSHQWERPQHPLAISSTPKLRVPKDTWGQHSNSRRVFTVVANEDRLRFDDDDRGSVRLPDITSSPPIARTPRRSASGRRDESYYYYD